MQRPPPPRNRRASRIPRPLGSMGDLRASSRGHAELARSHDSGISRSVSLVSLASMAAPAAASRTFVVTRRRALSNDVLGEAHGDRVVALFERNADECTAEQHFLHLECRQALEIAKSKIEKLESEIVRQQLENNRLRLENAATSSKEPPKDCVNDELDFGLILATANVPTRVKAATEEDDEYVSEADTSILEFWKNLHAPDKQKGLRREEISSNAMFPRSSSTPRNSMKSSCSETWTLDKSHNLISNSTCSTSKSTENLHSHSSVLTEHQPRKARSMHSNPSKHFEWKQCINRPRPSKLELVKATEDAGLVRRLESPAAISLLSPRPFNRQQSSQVQMVPPLDFSALHSPSSSSRSYQYVAAPIRSHHANHLLLQNAQNNVTESSNILKSLNKYFLHK